MDPDRKHVSIALGLALLQMCGCYGSTATTLPQSRSLRIEESPEFAALIYLIDRHPCTSASDRDFYSAYVVPNNELGNAIIREYPNHIPPLTNSIKVDSESGEARNADTGKRVKLWSAYPREQQDDHAIVGVSWYEGLLASAVERVDLERRHGKWVVTSVEIELIS